MFLLLNLRSVSLYAVKELLLLLLLEKHLSREGLRENWVLDHKLLWGEQRRVQVFVPG